MAASIVVFGATGFTGRLVAEALVARGERPVLAGRSAARLQELAGRLGGLDVREADVERPGTVFDLLGEGDVIVSTVGPFSRYGTPAVRSAIAAGGTYLDSTGEPAFIRRVFDEFGPPARRAGAALLTAMGYDWVPGTLAGALALEEAGEEAVRVEVGYYVLGGRPGMFSAGTRRSVVGVTLDPAFAFRGGALRTARSAGSVRSFEVRGKERPAVAVGGVEHFALPQAYPRLRDVGVFLGWFGPLARPMQALALGTDLVTRVPGVRTALREAGEWLVGMTGGAEAPDTGALSWIVGEAQDAAGRPLATVALTGAEPYAFTGELLAWAARRAAHHGLEDTGALGSLAAFGLPALEEGCREAGLERLGAS
jgi:putative NAD(P)-binding protein